MTPARLDDPRQRLRLHAETHLKLGTAPASRGGSTGVQALDLLFGLAANPQRAGEALKLLHELQVHQVELDLQQEQLDAELLRLNAQLARQAWLFDDAPFGYLALDHDGRVQQVNRRAAQLLGLSGMAEAPRRIEDLVHPDDGPAIRDALSRLRAGADRVQVAVRARSGGHPLTATLTRSGDRGDGTVLMAFASDA